MKRLLLNFVYYNAVGHCVEGLKYAKGLFDGNEGLDISIALNSTTPTELARACSFVKTVYEIDEEEILEQGESAPCVRCIPSEWDYYLWDNRPRPPAKNASEESFLKFSEYCSANLKVRGGTGTLFPLNLPPAFRYISETRVDIPIPQPAMVFAAKYWKAGEKFSIMLAGGGLNNRYYPSLKSWTRIITSINDNFPRCTLYLIGATKSLASLKGGTHTAAFSAADIENLRSRFGNIVDCYDLGLWNQLAVIQQSDVFVSPHTGFGMAVLCIGTPWLTLSGGDWPEYFFNNGVPFYSVLPDDKYYPHAGRTRYSNWQRMGAGRSLRSKLERRLYSFPGGVRIPSFRERRVVKKIPEIVAALRLLLSDDFTYDVAFKTHLSNLCKANIDRRRMARQPWLQPMMRKYGCGDVEVPEEFRLPGSGGY